MTKPHSLFAKAKESTFETYAGCAWVYNELVSSYAKKQILNALLCLLTATLAMMAVPYIMKYVIDAASTGETGQCLRYLVVIAVVSTIGTIFGSIHDHFRERAWNRNFHTIHIRLVHKLYRRTLDEIVAENSEVGAEQIESLKDRVQNILYFFLFESSIVLATIFGATFFLFLINVDVGAMILLLTLFNVIWFFFFHALLDEKMESIDKKFRRATRRLVEKINLTTSVKAAGVERKTERQIAAELIEPLEEDFKIWGYWFQLIDVWRRLVNTLAPVLILMYGVTTNWSGGTLAAVSSLVFMISREYGFIGHLMRHLASQVARIKATRKALINPPAFDYDAGIIYTRSTTCT